jgi:hypothetical protein
MMTTHQEVDIDDSEPVQKSVDPIRAALAAAISSLMDSFPDCAARRAGIEEVMRSEWRIRRAMIRKIVH